jgi:hypothetical protein
MADERDSKIKFAEEWLKRGDDHAYDAALAVTNGNVGMALQIASNWRNDPVVAEAKIALIEEKGVRYFLPTKEQQASDIYKMATDGKLDDEIRLKAHRLYAEIMGNIEKPSINQGGMQVVNQGVMIVKEYGTDDNWEQRAEQQQRKLIADATKTIHAPN